MAESLDYIATQLEAAVKGKKDLNKAIQGLLSEIIKENKRIIFNGDNYTEAWHKEAEKRGLPNHKNTVDAIPVITRRDTLELFTKYKVYSERELHSRLHIFSEGYVKTLNIEAQLMVTMGERMIVPAALRYQTQVASAITTAKAAGVDDPSQMELLKTLAATTGEFQKVLAKLEEAAGHHAEGDAYAHAKHMRDKVLPLMVKARTLGDKLETLVADDLWPLPTYREMLFIK